MPVAYGRSYPIICLAAVCGIFFAAPKAAHAQAVTAEEMATLDLTQVDRLLDEIRQQVDLVKFGSNGLGQVGQAAETTTAFTAPDVAPSSLRSRGNALCFADNFYDQRTPAELDAYFDSVETIVSTALTTLGSFKGLQEVTPQGQCPPFMVGMVQSVDASLKSVVLGDLNGLVLHLEECWVDEGSFEADGSPLNIEARYVRARQYRTAFSNSVRRQREAAEWCE
ncbi:hypothetical protein [Algirhabdus cladophorae]|uniref:hypothetical protein n=1 Tax=Algirhabdus cladophorae TaxID=3377108 RepID=UPI003B845D42